MSKKIFAYIRECTNDQRGEEQLKNIKNYCDVNKLKLEDRDLVIERMQENIFDKQGYNALVDYMIRSGDTLIITELDRLGRDTGMIRDEWQRLQEKDVDIIIVNNHRLSTSGKTKLEKLLINEVIFEVLNYIAEKDKKKRRTKQAEGIQALKNKNNGNGIGRPKTQITKEFKVQYKLWKDNKQSAVETFNKLGLTKATFYRLVKEFEKND